MVSSQIVAVLGIDLGTTNSVVAVADDKRATIVSEAQGSRTIPSVVAFLAEGEVVVGDIARERRLLDAPNTIYGVKRLLGRPFDSPEVQRAKGRLPFALVPAADGGVRAEARGETYSLPEISAFVLRECRAVAEEMLGFECAEAVVTVPANFNQLQRSATRTAGRIAGIDVLRILNEPTAAAIAYGYGRGAQSERIAVYDLGGGTFDVTILALDGDVFQVEATGGDTFLGGEDVDVLIARRVAERFFEAHDVDLRRDRQAFERVVAASEFAKCVLTEFPETRVSVPDLLDGSGGARLSVDVEISREEVDALIEPLLLRSIETCERVLADAQLRTRDVDSVILVGGSTRIPRVRQIVSDLFGTEAHSEIDPDLVVALGASVQGRALTKDRPPKERKRVRKSDTLERGRLKRRARSEVDERRPQQPAFVPNRRRTDPLAELGVARGGTNPLAELSHSRVSDESERRAEESSPVAEPKLRKPAVLFADDIDDEDPSEAPNESAEPFAEAPSAKRPLKDGPIAPGALSISSLDLEGLFALPSETGTSEHSAPFRLDLEGLTPEGSEFELAPLPAPALSSSTFPTNSTHPSPAPVDPAPVLELEGREPPLLMDVTAQSLGLETAGRYCERLIDRNVPVPVEQTRFFSTAEDGQTEVQIRICQGESRDFSENQSLGRLVLAGLREAKRGEVIIEVTFALDANGTLEVSATDTTTGQAQRLVLHQVGLMSDDEIAEVTRRQEARWS